MSSMLARAKSMANQGASLAKEGADQAARQAKKTKLNADIMMLQNKVAAAKKDFGTVVYDAMAESNQEEVERLFAETKEKIGDLEGQIEAKRTQINDLKIATPRGSAGGESDASSSLPEAPPPQAIPEGWRKTATAEGREYYYHEATGETSWTVPS
jgi:DNA replication initiation complex subunit (GINS family)